MRPTSMRTRTAAKGAALYGPLAALGFTALLASGAAAAQTSHPTASLNQANEALMKLGPPERAEKLARSISRWCIGTEAFLMGIVGAGPGRGNAYWSLRCADGSTWAIQIDPQSGVTAIGCDEFAAAASGKECFKKF
jgi:hypothetical protein